MRILALLAPLLLAGCALLLVDVERYGVSVVNHDGYELVCEDLSVEECRVEADMAMDVTPPPPGSEVRRVVVGPIDFEVCWDGPAGVDCEVTDRLDTVEGWPPRERRPR